MTFDPGIGSNVGMVVFPSARASLLIAGVKPSGRNPSTKLPTTDPYRVRISRETSNRKPLETNESINIPVAALKFQYFWPVNAFLI